MSIAPAPRRSPVRWLAGRFRRRPSTPARSIAAADLFDRDALVEIVHCSDAIAALVHCRPRHGNP